MVSDEKPSNIQMWEEIKMADECGAPPLPTNRSKLHVEQFSQNTHWMLAEELITTKTQEKLPCNWVKIKVFFKKIASVPLGGSCEEIGGFPHSGSLLHNGEKSVGTDRELQRRVQQLACREAEWRDTSIPWFWPPPCSTLHSLPQLSSVCTGHYPLDGGHDWCGSDQSLHWMFSRTSSLASQPCLASQTLLLQLSE